jgi:hypothetical protein
MREVRHTQARSPLFRQLNQGFGLVTEHVPLASTEVLVRRAVEARMADFPQLSDAARNAAVEWFLEQRGREIRKKPMTADLRECRLEELPA